MADLQGFYSVIQYCPDASRLEAVNVGVLLFVPELALARARASRNNQRVARFFRRESFDSDDLNAAKDALVERVNGGGDRFESLEDLEKFVDTRGNELVLTKPRSVRVREPESDLNRLFEDLVGRQYRDQGIRVRDRALDNVFHRPSLAGRVLFDQRISLPILGKQITIPYAYQNGSLNLVKPQAFSGSEGRAIASAMALAVEGDLLQKYPEAGRERRLIIIPEYPEAVESTWKGQVRGVLDEYHIRTVEQEDLEGFAQEVEREAHLVEK